MSNIMNTGFVINAPEPIDKRMQVATYADLDAIPIKYNHMVTHVINVDKDYKYYSSTNSWVEVIYGSTSSWGSISGDINAQTDLINKFNQYSLLTHTHDWDGGGPHTHPPSDITDIDGTVVWVRPLQAPNFILVGSGLSTGGEGGDGSMGSWIVSDGTNTSTIVDSSTLSFGANFSLDPLTNVVTFTEEDPTVGCWIKDITEVDIANWNMAYSYVQLPGYVSWNLMTNNVQRTSILSGSSLNLVAGANIDITYSPTGVVTIGGSGITGGTAKHTQGTPSLTWVFIHNLDELNPVITVYDANGDVVIPKIIHADSTIQSTITFFSAIAGVASAVVGGKGTTGDIGPQGIQGIQGLQGIQGPQGLKGDAGAAGAQGIQGNPGAVGATGLQGLKGDTGLSGITYKGDYNSGTTYVTTDVVRSIVTGNAYYLNGTTSLGSEPSTDPNWSLFVTHGAQGEKGDQGIQGTKGDQGIQGLIGPQGIQGIQGIQGPPDGYSAYEVAVIAGFVGDVSAWLASLVGPQGSQGIQGITGSQGIQGIQGIQGEQGIQGLSGSSAYETAVSLGYIGTEEDWLISLNGADGIQGIQGIAGINGIDGTNGLDGLDGIQGIQGLQGVPGIQGIQGIGISSIIRTAGTNLPGTIDTYTITYTDSSTTSFGVYNGTNGVDGIDGVDGINANGGDMDKAIYDTTNNGIVDNAELVNGLSVQTAVPVGAIFTDTIYTLPFADNSTNWNTAFSWGNHAGIYAALGHVHSSSEVLDIQSTISGNTDVVANIAKVSFPGFTSLATDIKINGTQSLGILPTLARADHVHPIDTSRAAINQTMYIGTTAVAINRASATLALAGLGVITGTSFNTITGINNTLTSTSTTLALAAAQGKVLNDKFASYSLTSHTHAGVYQPVGTYSTDIHSNITALNAVSGTNTGDDAVNSLYSGLVSNATHIGDVTGSTALTLTDGVVTKVKLATALKGYTDLGNVSGTVNIDCSLGIHFKMVMTGAITSLTFSNYSTEQLKTITLEITGNFTIAQPTIVKGDWSGFDGTKTNQIQIYLFNVTTPVFSSGLINW